MAKIQTNKETSRRDVIVKAAAALFLEKGYNAASMRDLAEKVGVEAASLYNHIRSKEELLHDICAKMAAVFTDHMAEVERSPLKPILKIERILRFHIKLMTENFDEVYVSDREWRYLTEPYLSEYRTLRRNYRKSFAAIIETGIIRGEFNKIDASTAVLILLHAIGGIESWHRSKEKVSGEELENNMLTILLEGLKRSSK